MIIAFTITERHIAVGTRNDAIGCPAAVALSECLGPTIGVRVYPYRLDFGGRPCAIPADLAAWVRAYDQDEYVAPASFTVDTDRPREDWGARR